MMSDSLWMMRALPPGQPRSDSVCGEEHAHTIHGDLTIITETQTYYFQIIPDSL